MPEALSPLLGERDFESFSGSPLPLGEGLGVRAKTTVLNMDLVYASQSDLGAVFLPFTLSTYLPASVYQLFVC